MMKAERAGVIINRKRKQESIQFYSLITLLLKYSIILLTFSICMSLLFHTSLTNGIAFFAFQIFAIILPGFSLSTLFRNGLKTNIEWFAFSYLLGYGFDMILYLLLILLDLLRFSLFILVIVDMLCVILVSLRIGNTRTYVCDRDISGEKICSVFFIIVLFIEINTYAGVNLLPSAIEENQLFNDVLYWIGNTIELTKEFPPKNFRFYPKQYNYHYFSSMQLALVSIITEIKPVILGFAFSFIQPITLIITGAYLLFRKCNRNVMYIAFGLFLLLFTSGFENYSIVTYSTHIFIGPFGFDCGLGIFLFYIYLLLCQYRSVKLDFGICILLIITMTLLVGVKASFAAIGICGTGTLCLFWLFRKEYKKSFLIGIPILTVFVLLYLLVVNMSGYAGTTEAAVTQPKIYEAYPSLITLHNTLYLLSNIGIPGFVIEVFFTVIYCFLCNPCVYFMILMTISNYPFKKIFKNEFDISLIIMIVFGSILTLYVGMIGASSMYFMMATYPIGISFTLLNIEKMKNKKYILICIIALTLISFCGWIRGYGEYSIPTCIERGIHNYLNISDTHFDPLNRSYINASQYEAYSKLCDRSGELVTTNRENYVLGVFSEKYVIINDASRGLFTTKDDSEKELFISKLKNEGIQYIVYDIETTPDFILNTEMVSVYFSNSSTIIFEIL